MKIRISRHRHRASRRPEPLPLDLRDPDIMRAKQLAGRSRPSGAAKRTGR